jgi:hypothetical protein
VRNLWGGSVPVKDFVYNGNKPAYNPFFTERRYPAVPTVRLCGGVRHCLTLKFAYPTLDVICLISKHFYSNAANRVKEIVEFADDDMIYFGSMEKSPISSKVLPY